MLMEPSNPAAPPSCGAACGHDHLVEFYETSAFLVATVADFLAPALRGDDAAIVVATPEHRHAFAKALVAAGVDVEAATRDGRYRVFDAGELLSLFMIDGAPHPGLFQEVVGSVIAGAAQGGRLVKVYGEMVALLWADGDVTATIALEDLWNDIAAEHHFALLCAYPLRSFDDTTRAAFKRICRQHSAAIPAASVAPADDAAEQRRTVARLQHETEQLRAELRRLRAAQGIDGRLRRERAPLP
jgi:hypothetical protein